MINTEMEKSPMRNNQIILVALIVAFSLLGDAFLYVALPLEYQSRGLSLVNVGVLLSANRIIRFISNTFAGYAYKIKSLKSLLIISILAGTIINLSYGFIESFFLFLLIRLCWGITWSFLRLGGYLSVISNSDKAFRGRSMGIYQSVSSTGSLLGALIGGILLDSWGFKSASIFLALGTALGIPLAFTIKNDNSFFNEKEDRTQYGFNIFFGDSKVLSIGIGTMFTRLFLGSIIVSTLSLYLAESFGREGISLLSKNVGIASLTGFLLMFRLLSSFLFGPIFGILSDEFGRNRTIFILFISGSFSLFLLAYSQSLVFVIIGVLLAFTSAAGLGVMLTTEVSDLVMKKQVGGQYIMSAYTNWIDLGSAIGPLIVYSLLNNISFNLIFLSSALLLLLYAILRNLIK
ncbi:MAG: MFS transporter [Promethearchaeota archaeon]|jgi:MFS family permease